MKLPLKHVLMIAVIFIISSAVYINTLNGDFVWDAEEEIKNNEFIRDLGNWPRAFTTELSKMYRPLELITYMLDYELYGLNPKGYHITNILLHAICSLLVYALILTLIKERAPAFIAAMLFAVHPIHTESVAWVAARDDVLMAIFYLAAMMLVHKYLGLEQSPRRRKIILIGGILSSYVLALLSKEMAISLPLLVFALMPVSYPDKIKSIVKIAMLLFVVTIFYAAIRFVFLESFGQIKVYDKYDYIITVLTAPKIFIGYYLSALLFPLRLCADYAFPDMGMAEIMFYTAVVLLLVFIAVKHQKKLPLVCIGIIWVIITILPAMNFIPKSQLISERYLYLPSAGYVMIIAGIAHSLKRNTLLKHWRYAGSLMIFMFYAALTINRNPHWQNAQILWTETIKNPLSSTRPYYNLASICRMKGHPDQAIALYQTIIEKEEKKIEETIVVQNKLYGIFKAKVYAGIIRARQRIIAETLAEQAQSYLALGTPDQAVILLKEAITTFKNTAPPYLYLANIYYQRDQIDTALELYLKAKEITPDSASLCYSIALCFIKKQDQSAARQHLLKTLKLDPQYHNAKEKLKMLENF